MKPNKTAPLTAIMAFFPFVVFQKRRPFAPPTASVVVLIKEGGFFFYDTRSIFSQLAINVFRSKSGRVARPTRVRTYYRNEVLSKAHMHVMPQGQELPNRQESF